MNTKNTETTIVDEANERTYVVIAGKRLTEGEAYKAIRQELLRRKGNPVGRGETLIIDTTRVLAPAKIQSRAAATVTEPAQPEVCELIAMAKAQLD